MSHLLFIYITNVTDSSFMTVKDAQKQRKEAKVIKQLEKQKEQEAAEKAKLEESQNKKGKPYYHVMDCC